MDGAAVSHNWYVIVYVPLGVLAANDKSPLAFILSGPFATGVTSVFAVVTTTPLIVSFVITLPTFITPEPEATVVGPSSTASIKLVGVGVINDVLFPGTVSV